MKNDLDSMICPTCTMPVQDNGMVENQTVDEFITNQPISEAFANNTLFTTHCPMCKMVAAALENHHIAYDVVDDPQELTSRGFTSAPMFFLASENRMMDARETLVWANSQGGEA